MIYKIQKQNLIVMTPSSLRAQPLLKTSPNDPQTLKLKTHGSRKIPSFITIRVENPLWVSIAFKTKKISKIFLLTNLSDHPSKPAIKKPKSITLSFKFKLNWIHPPMLSSSLLLSYIEIPHNINTKCLWIFSPDSFKRFSDYWNMSSLLENVSKL